MLGRGPTVHFAVLERIIVEHDLAEDWGSLKVSMVESHLRIDSELGN